MPRLAEYKECTGCLACVDTCPHDALHGRLNHEGHIVPVIDSSKCVTCGLCERTCPVVEDMDYSSSPESNAYAAWAVDDKIRNASATAGAFAAMAQVVISRGGYVCGAAIVAGTSVRHICINRIEDLHLLQGSKYTQSDTSGIYMTTFQHLREGSIVLFSGTGCQVAGLYGYLGKRKYEGRLITVDLICGGVPSRFLIDRFIEHEPYTVRRIVSFRSKDSGWSPSGFKYNLKVEDNDGNIHDYTGLPNLITTGFSCEMTNRYSCYECKFAGAHRMSDFTIGDYWGVKDYPEQHHDGVSIIITHNERAEDFLDEAKQYLSYHPADIDDVVVHNRRLVKNRDKRYRLPERKYMSKIFQGSSYNTLKRIYAFDFDNKILGVIYKVYRIVATKLINWL